MIDWTFDPKCSEFLVRTPYTPRPWINYLTDGRYCALVSQTGGGFSFFLDPSHHVISRREQDLLLNDRPGRFLYVQDTETGQFWNVGGSPARRSLDQFECRHGFGWTRLSSVCQKIEATITFFVPEEADAEVWLIRIQNGDDRSRRLRLVAYSEWLLGNSLVDPVARRFDSFFKQAQIVDGVVIGRKLVWGVRGQRANRPWPYEVFGCTAGPTEPDAIWLEKEEFVGLFRDLSQPQALDEPDRQPDQRRELWGVDVIYGPQWSFSLTPGQCAEWAVVTGIAPTGEGTDRAARLADLDVLRDQLEATRAHWRRRVDRLQVRTPDADLNAIQNRWTPYEVIIKSYLSSAPSYYHASDGSPGFRDALQDAFGLCLIEPERARRMILRLAEFQFSDGRASHRAPRVPLPPERSEKSDLPLWLSLPTLQYIRETGDPSIITEPVPFADGPEAPLLEHIRLGLERSLKDVGPRGLPLIHYGDWNDALDGLGGKGQGESVFLAQFLVFSLKNSATLAELAGASELAAEWRKEAARLTAILNEKCWQEDRFVRAFHDDGTVIGCRENREGRLYLNPQVWAVLADAAPRERLLTCMDTVHRELDSPYGIRCLAPAYSQYDSHVGLISCFPPGIKENGAIFSHAMAFCLVAELMLGRADRAWSLLKRANPVTRARERPEYRMEPYVYCQFVAGPETNLRGQGFHHWLTGTCSWMQYAIINWLLGVRPELDGLVVDPCIPNDWKRFELTRPFRGRRVHVVVENPNGVSRGVVSVSVNGQSVEGNRIRDLPDGDLTVHATMG